jgi:hypothetical protein
MYFLMPVVSCQLSFVICQLLVVSCHLSLGRNVPPAPCSLLPFLFQIIADKFGELIFLAIVKSILIQF